MTQAKKIVIVGAGLVGSLLAVLLGRRGYQVTVYEKRSDMRTSEISAGRSINLALARRGIDPLKRAELFDDVEKLLIPMRGRMLHRIDGELEFLPYGQREHEVIYSVSRGELNKLMMTAAQNSCQVDIHFDHACQDIDFDRRIVQVSDAKSGATQSVEYDLLFGADGAGSIVRDLLMKKVEGDESVDFLEHRYKELSIDPGPHASFAMEKEALHIWPRGGYMLIALPNLDGSYTVTLFLSESGSPGFHGLNSRESVQQFFSDQFPDAMQLMPNLLDDFFENPTGLLGTVRCSPWHFQQSALILGDASHAIVPFHGQGMNAGFEDCLVLVEMLDQSDDDWDSVLPQFSAARRPNADAIADMALENYVIMRDSVRDEKFQLKKELGFELEKRMPDRFIPRYSMVMFHRIPYAEALSRGRIQDEILESVVQGASDLNEVDLDFATALVTRRLLPVGTNIG